MEDFTKRNARVWSMLGMRRVIGQVLNDMPKLDDNFIFMTADVARYFGTEKFQEAYPERYIDVGIAEQNLIGVASGMAKEGFNVFAATYATFITARVLDQVRVNLGYMNLGVKLIGVGGGLAEGDLSPTHMGLEDIANLRSVPNMTIIAPADGMEAVKAMYALAKHEGPAYLRLTGRTNTPIIYKEDYPYEIGKSNILRQGEKIALIAYGTIVDTALKVADNIEEKTGEKCTVIDMHTIKPIDRQILDDLSGYKLVVSMEEHMAVGGLGSAIAEFYADKKIRPIHQSIAINDYYPSAGEYELLLENCDLTETKITEKIIRKYNEVLGDV